jgi:hypothetical protein
MGLQRLRRWPRGRLCRKADPFHQSPPYESTSPRARSKTRLWLGALSGHDGLIRVATLHTFHDGQRLACRRHPWTGCLRTPDNSWPCFSLPCFWNLPCFRPVASSNRLHLAALLALILVVEECTLGADDLRALDKGHCAGFHPQQVITLTPTNLRCKPRQ